MSVAQLVGYRTSLSGSVYASDVVAMMEWYSLAASSWILFGCSANASLYQTALLVGRRKCVVSPQRTTLSSSGVLPQSVVGPLTNTVVETGRTTSRVVVVVTDSVLPEGWLDAMWQVDGSCGRRVLVVATGGAASAAWPKMTCVRVQTAALSALDLHTSATLVARIRRALDGVKVKGGWSRPRVVAAVWLSPSPPPWAFHQFTRLGIPVVVRKRPWSCLSSAAASCVYTLPGNSTALAKLLAQLSNDKKKAQCLPQPPATGGLSALPYWLAFYHSKDGDGGHDERLLLGMEQDVARKLRLTSAEMASWCQVFT